MSLRNRKATEKQMQCIFCHYRITISHISRHIKLMHPQRIQQWKIWKNFNHLCTAEYTDWIQERKRRRKVEKQLKQQKVQMQDTFQTQKVKIESEKVIVY